MTGSLTRALAAVLVLFSGCAQAQGVLVVGAVVSQTGAHADLAADYGRGIELWRDEVNAAGGLLGRQVELRMLDDGSEAARAGALYRQLLREKADALIGPYGTAATLVAAAEAESAQRVMINGAGWSSVVHKRTPRFVFQSAVPYGAYGAPVVELARNRAMKSALILAREDPASLEMAAAAAEAAARMGIVAGEVLRYPAGTLDFLPLATTARDAGIDAWIAFGDAGDAAEMIKAFRKLRYAPRMAFMRGAADPRLLELVGQDAEYAMGAAAYHPRRPGADAFARAFHKRWQRAPGAAAAEGYAAGSVLAAGIGRAKSAEPRALRAALASMQTETVLGTYRVDPATGAQAAAQPLVVQVLLGQSEIVAPEAIATAPSILPYPAWEDRRLIK